MKIGDLWYRGPLWAPDPGSETGAGSGAGGGGADGGGDPGSEAGAGSGGGDAKPSQIPDAGGGKKAPDGILAGAEADAEKAKGDQGDDPGSKAGAGSDGDDGEGEKKAGELYRPKGLAKHMLGETDQETIDKLMKANAGLRKQVSEKPATAPEKPEDYTIDLAELPVAIDPEGNEQDAQVMDIVRGVAHEISMNQDQFQGFVGKLVTKLDAAGLISGAQSLEEQRAVAVEEFGDEGKFNAAVSGVLTWGQNLVRAGQLSQDEYEEFKIAGGNAKGLRMLMALRGLSGEPPIPLPANLGDGAEVLTRDRLRQMQADPRADPASPKFEKAYADKVQEAYKSFAAQTKAA